MKLTPNQGSILLLALAMSLLPAASPVMADYDRGSYFLQRPDGDYNETISAGGCISHSFSAVIGEGEKTTLKLYSTGALPTDVSSPGTVMDADGGSLSGALLHADPGGHIFAPDEVGGDGFHLVSGNYSLRVSADDDETSLIQPSVPDLSRGERFALLLLLLEMAGR